MKTKKILLLLSILVLSLSMLLAGCGSGGSDSGNGQQGSAGSGQESSEASAEADAAVPEDGTYVVSFTTDHAMFHVNDANNDKGILTVKDGKMTVHVSLQSKKIVNLFCGKKEDAQKEGAELLQPTTDTITYDDGYTEDVYGFDIPVPALDQEFDVALIGTKGNWYDHKVIVSDPVPGDDIHAGTSIDLEDGEYRIDVAMEGGTGKASVESPAKMTVKDGNAVMTVTWSSPYYDYMIVDGEKYEPVNTDGNSVFEIPVKVLNAPFKVIGDTTAMSEPHEIEYTFTCTLQKQ